MNYVDPIYTAGMTDHQRAWFYAEYEQARRDEVVGVLLALLLGGFGLHHFYLRRTGLGILYLLFSWTGIPVILGFIEAFFMPGRVRAANALQANYISGQIRASGMVGMQSPPSRPPAVCSSCGTALTAGAGFCPRCGIRTVAGQPAS